ncbi:DUF1292 domain-containing protein [Peribacillus saganii]|uniref:DUF1292 domain-containing protein n=1 Tax=Peribacillus saganii TaxID=2303992 RepID=A0A372LJP1_9BACI|nr:DUF1292 domain-containing protein [Peribacillus saganii]RFU66351.1 DUF1292 domain-containing protein [Peribacillus saganii]
MDKLKERDIIAIQNEQGEESEYAVEALFEMNEGSYALLSSGEDSFLMRVESEGDQQYLVNIDDPDEKESLLDAYLLASTADYDDPRTRP